jgi:hypothetical protein
MLFRRLAIVFTVVLVQTAPLAVAQVTLKPKIVEGATYKARQTQNVTQSLGLNGMNIETKADVAMTSHTAIGKRDAEKKLSYTTTFDSILADLNVPGGKIKFDSANPDAKSENPNADMVLDAFRKLKDTALTITLGKDNQIASIEGIKEGSGLAEEDLKNNHKQNIDRLPSDPVKQGDTWERTEKMDLGQGQFFVIKRKYEYAGTAPKFPTVKDSPKLDKITATDLTVEYKVKEAGAIPIKVNESDLKVASSKYTFLFDRELGRMVDEQGELQVKGTLKLSIMGTALDGTLDLKIETRNQEVE